MTSSTGKRVGYIRVSSVDQNTERQLDGEQLDKVFTEKASGKDTKRPQLKAVLEFLREGDTLVVHSMDRLARNLEDLCRMVRELTADGVTVEFKKERLQFSREGTEPFSELLLHMLGAVAQFERSLLRERQREGIEKAKAKGKYKGRKPSLSDVDIRAMQLKIAGGVPKAEVARQLGISRETVYAYLRKPEEKRRAARTAAAVETKRLRQKAPKRRRSRPSEFPLQID